MSDYINREEALNQFYTLYYFPKGSGDQYMGQIESIHDRIRDLPSADVVERKKGEWQPLNSLTNKCTSCGEKYWFYLGTPFNFCPNCGARMVTDDGT